MAEGHVTEDVLVDLALSELDERDSDAVTTHLALCEPCRARYAAVADGVEHVLLAAPRVQPPPGFSAAVLAAIGGQGPATGRVPGARAPAEREPRAPARGHAVRRPVARVWLVAAAAVAGLAVGATGAILLDQRQDAQVVTAGAPLVTDDGAHVGTVTESWFGGAPVYVVALPQTRPDVTYECVLVLADGTRRSAGTWEVTDGAATTWVVDRPDDAVLMEMVTGTGRIWATAEL